MRHALLLFGVTCLSSPAFAGAWPMPAGKGQMISTNVTNRAAKAFDDRWKLNREVDFAKKDSHFFWEHGLTSKITLVGTTAFQDVDFTSREGRKQVTGFGASSLGARYPVYRDKKNIVSLQASAVIAGNAENISDADLGRGGNGIELMVLAGRSFKIGKRRGFIDIQSSWLYRSGASPHSFKDDITIGLDVTPRYQLLAQGFYNRTNAQLLHNDLILPNESYKLQASVVHKRSARTSYQFGGFRTVAGRNIVQESGVFAGYWRRY